MMSGRSAQHFAAFVLLAACVTGAGADDKAEYDRRSVARYMTLFQSLDRNADGAVTRAESQGDLNFGPRFDDMDINRDGIVTLSELQRYIEKHHAVQATAQSGGVAPPQ